ncbi:MAG TPA: PAS domain S-box protein, partial [Flavisolibacter sp.]|nr:PAS domain S-box protein [Flavisolibacter sp.]
MRKMGFAGLSIRQRLPLLVCTLLLSVLLIFGVISYLGVRKATLKAGRERLKTLSQQMAAMLSASTQNLITGTYTASQRPAVKSFLSTGGKDSAAAVNAILQKLQKDSSYVKAELINLSGITLHSFSNRDEVPSLPTEWVTKSASKDSGMMGKIFTMDHSVFYPIVATVTVEGKPGGYLVLWRQLAARSKAVDQLSQLMGTDAQIYIGNADGSLWTDMMKPVAPLPVKSRERNDVFEFKRADNIDVLASVHPIANSPWLFSVTFPKSKILQTANSFLYWLIVSGLVLLVVGIFWGWMMSRSISDPLTKLTKATGEIAAGRHYGQVQVNRRDELGKLARAFNAMSAKVQQSRKELEQKADNYKLLFEHNPMPMWIISKSTLGVLDVNQAAILHYGYSREEFLQLSSKDLRPAEDVEKYMAAVATKVAGRDKHGIWRHKKKDGTVIMVDIIVDDIIYQNQEARLILGTDVTEKLKAEAELIRNRAMQQQIITETAIQVQEREREEIGKELHDNINQILASTKLYLELAKGENKDLFPEAIEKSYENINLAIAEIRQLSKQLVPPTLNTPLRDCLAGLTEELAAITPIEIALNTGGFDETLLDDTMKLTLYRIVQEQLNNILKYAAASRVLIALETAGGRVYMKIADNGVGFDL